MTFSSLANRRGDTVKKSARLGVPIDTFQVHHGATTDRDWMWNVMTGPGGRSVSANYIITNEGEIWGVVPEEYRAWTSGSPEWDRRSITIEIENETGAPDWDISQRALQAAANLLADVRGRYGIKNVPGHRDLWQRYGASYPTYCPGPNTVDQILALAPNEGGGGSPDPSPSANISLEDNDMLYVRNTETGYLYQLAPGWINGLKPDSGREKAWRDAGLPEPLDLAPWSFERIQAHFEVLTDGDRAIVAPNGDVLDVLHGEGYVRFGTWSRARKAERFAWLAKQ